MYVYHVCLLMHACGSQRLTLDIFLSSFTLLFERGSVNLALALSALPAGQQGPGVPLSLFLLPSTWDYRNVPPSAGN